MCFGNLLCVVILVIAPCVYFRNDLCSLGYLHIFQTAKWTKIQKAEKKKRVLVLGKRSTIEIRFIFCTEFVMCITLSDTKAVFMRVEGTERFI